MVFFGQKAGRHFSSLKRTGRHQKGAGCRTLQKRPRQNTGQGLVLYASVGVHAMHACTGEMFGGVSISDTAVVVADHKFCVHNLPIQHTHRKSTISSHQISCVTNYYSHDMNGIIVTWCIRYSRSENHEWLIICNLPHDQTQPTILWKIYSFLSCSHTICHQKS